MDSKPKVYTQNEYNIREMSLLRMIISTVLFTVFSVVLTFCRFSPSLLPNFISVEYSVFAELLASIAYGPIVGGIVCLLKGAIYTAFVHASWVSNIAMFLYEGVFVVIAGYYYQRTVFGERKNADPEKGINIHRRRTIIKGSLIGMVPAIIIQTLLAYYFVFPLLNKFYGQYGYNYNNFIASYAESANSLIFILPDSIGKFIPKITAVWQGILIINTPFTFFKLLFVTLIVAWIYPIISPYLHFAKKA